MWYNEFEFQLTNVLSAVVSTSQTTTTWNTDNYVIYFLTDHCSEHSFSVYKVFQYLPGKTSFGYFCQRPCALVSVFSSIFCEKNCDKHS